MIFSIILTEEFNMKKMILLSIIALLALPGCISYPGGVASSSVPITDKDSYTIVRRNASGTDSAATLFGIIPLMPLPSTWQALNDAKKQCNADAIINLTVETEYNFAFLVIWFQEIKVTGDAITFRTGGADIE
jgi:hypothetical protein